MIHGSAQPETPISIDENFTREYATDNKISKDCDISTMALIDYAIHKQARHRQRISAINMFNLPCLTLPLGFDELLCHRFLFLKRLEISNCGLTCLNLSGLRTVQELDFAKNKLECVSITDFQSLNALNLSHNRISELNISICPSINSLDISHNPRLDIFGLVNQGNHSLASLQSLSVQCTGQGTTEDNCRHMLLHLLPQLPNLKMLNGYKALSSWSGLLIFEPKEVVPVATVESKNKEKDTVEAVSLELLLKAVNDGSLEVLRNLFQNCTNVEVAVDVLIRAASHGHTDMVHWVLQQSSVDVNSLSRCEKQMTALHCCCRYNCIDTARVLVEDFHANVNCRDRNGRTPLHYCAMYSRMNISELAYLLIANNADVRVVDQDMNNCLHLACVNSNGRFIDCLVGVPHLCNLFTLNSKLLLPNSLGSDGIADYVDGLLLESMFIGLINGDCSDIWLACMRNCFHDSVRLSRRVIGYQSPESSQTFLMIACYNGLNDACTDLIQFGSNVNLKDNSNYDAAHYAVAGFLQRGRSDWIIVSNLILTGGSFDSCECVACGSWMEANRERLQSRLLPISQRNVEVALSNDSHLLKNAITSNEFAELSPEFIMKCTLDFAESNKIGSGASANVYKACDTSVGTYFAVKVATRDVAPLKRVDLINSLKEEVVTMKHFSHPFIIKILGSSTGVFKSVTTDLGEDYCIVLEFARHGSLDNIYLSDILCRNMTWKLRIRMMADVAKALSYMHNGNEFKAGHRDVKSANIVVTSDFHAKLIDCGISILADKSLLFSNRKTLSQTGTVLGTPGYMCSRYINSGKFDEKSEIFSFGIFMLELMSGRLTSSVIPSFAVRIDDGDEESIVADDRAGEWPREVLSELLRISSSCAGRFPKRPKFIDLCRSFATLDRQASLNSSDFAALQQLEHREDQRQKHQLESSDSRKLAEWELRNSTPFECKICLDNFRESDGVLCGNRHFTCSDCFNGHVLHSCSPSEDGNQLTKMNKMYARSDGNSILGCPTEKCDYLFLDRDIINCIGRAEYDCYMKGRRLVMESVFQEGSRIELEEKLKNELARIQSMNDRQRAVYKAKHEIVETILTLKCPKCKAAFLDFNGCMALTCHMCSCGFCGFCLQGCSADAHSHVASCSLNKVGGYFASKDVFEDVQKQRRIVGIREYLKNEHDADVKISVIADLHSEFRDLGIDPNEIMDF